MSKVETTLSSPHSSNTLLPAVAAMPIRNFYCKLPNDFFQLLSIELLRKPKTFLRRNKDGARKFVTIDCNFKLPFVSEMEQMRWNHSCYADDKMFVLQEDKVIFSGSYSKWLIIKWLQKLKEYVKPEIAVIQYIDFQTALNSDPKLKERFTRMVNVALSHSR